MIRIHAKRMAAMPRLLRCVCRLRSPRLGLRTFLLGMTVITAILGFYADLSRRQRWAVAHILSMRGKVNYSFEPDAEELRRRDLLAMQAAHQGIVAPEYRDRPSAPKWLVDLCGLDLFATVSVVSLAGTMDEARQERGTP